MPGTMRFGLVDRDKYPNRRWTPKELRGSNYVMLPRFRFVGHLQRSYVVSRDGRLTLWERTGWRRNRLMAVLAIDATTGERECEFGNGNWK